MFNKKEKINIWEYVNEDVERLEVGSRFQIIGKCDLCKRHITEYTRKEKHTFLGYDVILCINCIKEILRGCGIINV